MRLVVLGIMGRTPLAGVVWQALHYLEGFRRLGSDVYYIEDTGDWPYDPVQNTVSDDCGYTVNYIGRLMAKYGFSDHWAYCAGMRGGGTFGLSESQVLELFEGADVLVNVTGSTLLRDEHLQVPVRIYLETDPALPQIEIAKGNKFYIDLLSAHTHHFTYGENLGAPDCGIPSVPFNYRPTRQPIVLDWWAPPTISASTKGPCMLSNPCFTTIANWRQSGKDIDWNGKTYTWSKHHQFLKFIDLPRRASQPLELGLALQGSWDGQGAWTPHHKEDTDAIHLLSSHAWRIINGLSLSTDIEPYCDYIRSSRGEFTVAKEQYARLRSGWFSDRSACYLAAARPVVTQDTGFGKFIPTGQGLFAFNTMEEILAAFDAINSDYECHSRGALELATEHFSADRVLGRLLRDAGLK